jgi:uncharacterized membrane protein
MKIWRTKRNCSLTPKQLSVFYALLVGVSLSVGIGFFIAGIWVVPIFTTIEVTAVTIGFLVYSRHALDFEEIQIDGTKLIVKKFIGYQERIYEFNTLWTELTIPPRNSKVFRLSEAAQTVEVGQFVPREQLRFFIAELRRHLK